MDLTPRTTVVAGSDYTWMASAFGVTSTKSASIDFTKLTENIDYPNGYIQSGFAVGLNPTTGKLEPYEYGDTYKVVGFVLHNEKITDGDVSVAYLTRGDVHNDRLPFPLDANGITEFSKYFLVLEEGGS